jgi:prolyl oligopeptidase
MHRLTFLIIVTTICYSCNQKQKAKNHPILVNYPKTKTVDTVDTYFDVDIKDPYRWLEDDRSDATAAWVKTQN